MTHDPWFWVSLAAYFGGAINILIWTTVLIWITDGGTMYSKVARWRIFVVAVFWPVCTTYGMLLAFYEWFMGASVLLEN